jgi:hypothetical protein
MAARIVNPWELLGDAMAGAPRLPGAACRGMTWMADIDERSDPADIARAQRICRSCPALAACAAWVAATPPRMRPAGVTAGRLQQPAPRAVATDRADDPGWLAGYLAAHGPTAGADVIAAAAAAGIGAVRCRKAAHVIGVQRTAATHGGPAVWSMPGAGPAAAVVPA